MISVPIPRVAPVTDHVLCFIRYSAIVFNTLRTIVSAACAALVMFIKKRMG
jgi:hypothetical protein